MSCEPATQGHGRGWLGAERPGNGHSAPSCGGGLKCSAPRVSHFDFRKDRVFLVGLESSGLGYCSTPERDYMETRCLLCEGQLRWVQLLTKQRFYFVFWFSIMSTSLTQHTYLKWPSSAVEEVEHKIHKTRNKYVSRKKSSVLRVPFVSPLCSHLWSVERTMA